MYETADKTTKEHMHLLSLSHSHTHASCDVKWLACSTVDDRLHLAAPETDRQSGYCSAGTIQCWEKLCRTESEKKKNSLLKNCSLKLQ